MCAFEGLEDRYLLATDLFPAGSLIQEELLGAETISVAGEVDAFTAELDEGQTITLVAEPSGSLQPGILVLDPQSVTLATALAAANEAAVIQTVATTSAGTYRFVITGQNESTGGYNLTLLINAALELESLIGGDNSSPASAQDIEASFIELGQGNQRSAVVGNAAGAFGPDAFGYAAISVPFAFENIRTTGTRILTGQDDATTRLNNRTLGGFTFPFYGSTYSTLFVSTNGLITFGDGDSNPENSDLTDAPIEAAIAPLWDDLDLGSSGAVIWQVVGTGDDRRLVVEWSRVQFYPFFDGGDPITFQAVLYESDGSIQLNYFDLRSTSHSFESDGRSATVGIKDIGAQGDRRLLLSLNGSNPSIASRQSLRVGVGLAEPLVDYYRFSLADGQMASLALASGTAGLELYDSTGTSLLARGIAAANVDQLIARFVDMTSDGAVESYLARVAPSSSSLSSVDYTLLITRGLDFERESNRGFERAQETALVLGAITVRDVAETTLLGDFAGMSELGTSCNCEPPDSHAAVGPNHIVQVVNTAIAIFNKDGSLASPPVELTSFFDARVVAGEAFDFDPVVVFDDLAQRWIVAILIGGSPGALETDLLYAVSDSADPTAGFREQHRIDFGEISPGLFADFPKLGFNSESHVFTVNMFSDFFFEEVNIVAIDKSTVLDADPSTFAHFVTKRPSSSFTMAAATMHDASPGDPMWFVEEAQFGGGDRIRLVRMENVLSDVPVYSEFNLRVRPYDFTPPAIQPGGFFTTNDTRISNADYRDGRLVAAHAVGVAGESTVRWYEFDVTTDEPTLSQQGEINPGPGKHAYFPSIAINMAGDLGLTYLQSSATEFVSMYVTGQVMGSEAGVLAAPALVRAGDTTYVGFRGGDYSAVTVDPLSDTFWAANEVSLSGPLDPFWSTWITEFSIADIPDEDWYQFAAVTGDELTIRTDTPLDGPGLVTNELDPRIELYSPEGQPLAADNDGNSDGRNALLRHTVAQNGLYRVRVIGHGGSNGTYLLRVEGATGPRTIPAVRDTNPDTGTRLGVFPGTYTVTFSEAILTTSVQPEDLIVGGLPATAVTQIDGQTFRFGVDQAAAAGDRQYAVVLAAGAVLDLQGQVNDVFEASFILDQTGPRIIETKWNAAPLPADRIFNADDRLVFEATIDEPLFSLSSARRGLLAPGTDDAFLINEFTGEVIHPELVELDQTQNSFSAQFAPLTEGSYTLRLVSGDRAFEDVVGNHLDGEPLGTRIDGTPTGDGVPGGDYHVEFEVDRDTLIVTEFEPVAPLGGLVRLGQIEGLINNKEDADHFVFSMEGGQTVAALARPLDPNALVTIDFGGLLQATATAGGQVVAVPPQRFESSGQQTITVTADRRTRFSLEIFLNTSLEAAIGDSEPGSGLMIDDSFLDVGSGRYAAVGSSSPTPIRATVLAQSFEAGLDGFTIDNNFGSGRGLWHLSSGRSGDGLPSHSPPRNLYFGRRENAFGGSDYDVGTATGGAVLSSRITLPFESPITLTFNHLLETEGSLGFDIAEVAAGRGSVFRTLLSTDDGSLPPSTEGIWQTATADLTQFAGSTFFLRFSFDSIDDFSNEFEGWFIDDVAIEVTTDIIPDVDEYLLDLTGRVGQRVDIVLAGFDGTDFSPAMLELRSGDGALLATASALPLGFPADNFDLAILDFTVPADGLYRIHVNSTIEGRYTVLVTDSLAVEVEKNDASLGASVLRALDGWGGALGYLDAEAPVVEFVMSSEPSRFVDISSTGTPLNLADDGVATINTAVGNAVLPAGPVSVSNNGVLAVGSNRGVSYENEPLPFEPLGAALLPFWDDLDETAGNVYWEERVVEGIPTLIVQWHNRAHFLEAGNITFQVQVHESGPVFARYVYRDVDFGLSEFDAGSSATIGYQQNASTALQFSFNMPSVRDGDVLSLRAADTSDDFEIHLTAGQQVSVSTRTPVVGSESLNTLNPRIEVLDSAGNLVAADADSLDGRNATISIAAPSSGTFRIRVIPESGRGEYVLRIDVSSSLPGDFNGDGRIDGNDFLLWQSGFGIPSGATRGQGDGDLDGDVDGDDFLLWQQGFGSGLGSILGGGGHAVAVGIMPQENRPAVGHPVRSLRSTDREARQVLHAVESFWLHNEDAANLASQALDSALTDTRTSLGGMLASEKTHRRLYKLAFANRQLVSSGLLDDETLLVRAVDEIFGRLPSTRK